MTKTPKKQYYSEQLLQEASSLIKEYKALYFAVNGKPIEVKWNGRFLVGNRPFESPISKPKFKDMIEVLSSRLRR